MHILGDWYLLLDPLEPWPALFQYFLEIFDGMVNKSDFGISVYDIAAILDPVPTYLAPHKQPRRFQSTIHEQKVKNNQTIANKEYFERYYLINHDHDPLFLKENNYFGKILGPHLKAVMEIMYHCMLRPRSIPRDRFFKHHLSDLYGNLQAFMKFPISIEEPFTPLWEDYLAYNKTPYWLPMTHFKHPFVFEQGSDSKIDPFSEASNTLEQRELIENLKRKHQMQQMMALCKGPGSSTISCQNHFQPVLTDLGICYAFNAHPFNDTFSGNSYLETFQDIFEPNETNMTLIQNLNSGKNFQMYLILDSHLDKVYDSVKGSFKVAINQNIDFMDVAVKYIDADIGALTKILVVPTQYTTTEAFKVLPLDTRKCRFTNENPNPDSLFRYYGQKSCVFECHVKYAHAKCGCTPWNYPHFGNESVQVICDGILSYCFKQKMQEQVRNCSSCSMTKKKEHHVLSIITVTFQQHCDCLPNCEEVTFEATESSKKLNYFQECQVDAFYNAVVGSGNDLNHDFDFPILLGEKLKHMDGEEFYFHTKMVEQDGFEGGYMLKMLRENNYYRYISKKLMGRACVIAMEDNFAFLTIEVAGPDMISRERSVAVTFEQKISSLGKYPKN
jgi:hypothetical protein